MSDREAELVELYRSLSDEELVERQRSKTLIDLAQKVADAEVNTRNLEGLLHLQPAPAIKGSDVTGAPSAGFVTVFRCSTAPEAHVIQARLKAESIPALIVNEHFNQANFLLTPAIGGAQIQVPMELEDEAKSIIKLIHENDFSLAVEEAASDVLVPQERPPRWEFLLSALILFNALYDILRLGSSIVANVDKLAWDNVNAAGIYFPMMYLAAAILLVMRKRWALIFFGVHFLSIPAVYAFHVYVRQGPGDLAQLSMRMTAIGIMLYFCFHLFGKGRLR